MNSDHKLSKLGQSDLVYRSSCLYPSCQLSATANGLFVGWLEFAGVENDGLENDGVEQEQTYILHTMKNFNVYDMQLFQALI